MKVLIVDDHAILRKGLVKVLRDEFKDVEILEASNGNEALKILKEEPLDIALMDISMPGMNGIEVLKQVRSWNITTPIMIVSMQPEEQYAIRVMKSGAKGFLKKESAPNEIIKAVKKILDGKKYLSETIIDLLAESSGGKSVQDLSDLLSDRELEVLQHLAKGKSVTEIGNEIGLSVNTVSTYRSRILQKLQLKNNAAIIRYAIEHNLV